MIFRPPAKYFPPHRGLYEVAPGLRPLSTDFGNGQLDQRVFQIDSDFPRFRQNKLACRQDQLDKYFQVTRLPTDSQAALITWMTRQLLLEYPDIFSLADKPQGPCLTCLHTDEKLQFTPDHQLLNSSSSAIQYTSAIDALANQVAEDICLTQRDAHSDWLAVAHVCSPGHWSPAEKIGKPFTAIHQPVPHIQPITRRADQFVDIMINRGPFVRFAWGFGTDDRLNHHPHPPAAIHPTDWRGRLFDPAKPEFFLRIERQVMCGLPSVNAAVFTIKVSHLSGALIKKNPTHRQQLISALQSMSTDSLQYKGLDASIELVIRWLGQTE